ncbi:hypothetical protein H5410_016706 [Solanum commersonii]|uniref:Uncharacterized protein n=1 Tax=Solanum commersonii TaxID=4109 RepID=A0A9J5ZY25_SOLCO|nr:hypothetical protein H5410_016706 [Solanum commersonii]
MPVENQFQRAKNIVEGLTLSSTSWSHSAPSQRLQFEKIGSTKYADGLVDADTNSENSWSSPGNFRNKAKPGSGQSGQ